MQTNIESHLIEKRVFKPLRDFAKNARIQSLGQYRRMYRESMQQPAKFWAREASELVWRAKWKRVLEWKAPFANVLKRNKIKKGDRVIIYLPNIPEAAVAMLACARIGAVHSVVFGGFSSESICD